MEDQLFFFNVKLDEIGEPILGVGKCEKDHTNKKLNVEINLISI